MYLPCISHVRMPLLPAQVSQRTRTPPPLSLTLSPHQVSQRISLISQTEASKYEANAVQFEQWACSVLDKCRARDDAMLVLTRMP